VHYHDCFVR
nr:RecName: Full=Peroxidase 4 [Solanum lycopersicum]